jgi:heme exporter protein CcmD
MIEQMLHFLWMGGYALYVWLAVAWFAIIFFIVWWLPARQLKSLSNRSSLGAHE